MTIAEVSKKYDISADTLRYYERIGMIPHVNRTASGLRDYNEQDCSWVELAICMRSAGLPVEVIIEYLRLFQQGNDTIPARCELLLEQRTKLVNQKKTIEGTIDRLNYKISRYEEAIKTGVLSWEHEDSMTCTLHNSNWHPSHEVFSNVEQYVMAYDVDWDMLKNILPKGYRSLRPVLRINVELLSNISWLAGRSYNRIELNTPVEYKGKKGWLNLVTWENDCDSIAYGKDIHGIPKIHAIIHVEKNGKETKISAKNADFTFLNITFIGVGKVGGCPKEDDNEGTFHFKHLPDICNGFQKAEAVDSSFMTAEKIDENKEYCDCSFEWSAPTFNDYPTGYAFLNEICDIENQKILGAYVVSFDRTKNEKDQVIL